MVDETRDPNVLLELSDDGLRSTLLLTREHASRHWPFTATSKATRAVEAELTRRGLPYPGRILVDTP